MTHLKYLLPLLFCIAALASSHAEETVPSSATPPLPEESKIETTSSQDLDFKKLAVRIIPDRKAFEIDKQTAFFVTDLSPQDQSILSRELIREISKKEIFTRVITANPISQKLHKPGLQLDAHATWFGRNARGRNAREQIMIMRFSMPIPSWGGNKSEREWGRKMGLMIRLELREIASEKLLTRWYTFCNATFSPEEKTLQLQDTLMEEKLLRIMHKLVKIHGTPE
jgi:hypothetical protein